VLARDQPAQGDRAEGDTPELRDRVAHRAEQSFDLVVLPLVQRHLDPGMSVDRDQTDLVDHQELTLHPDAPPETSERLGAGDASDLRVVHARDLEAGVGHALGERAVVGEEDEALGGEIQPAHREEPGHTRHQVHDRGTARRIPPGGDDPAWLVECDVDGLAGRLHPHAVNAHVVASGIGLRAELADDDPVDAHPTLLPRREAKPARARSFWSRSGTAAIIPHAPQNTPCMLRA
jgi:hypothetical protein